MAPKKKGVEKDSVKKSKKEDISNAPSRDHRAATLLEDINKQLKGRAVLKPASEYCLPYLTKRLPTGLLTLDLELRGGFPAGGISQIIGRRNAGKTLLAWHMIRQLQHFLGDKMKVLLAMTEIPADRSQARLAGVQISLGADELLAISNSRKLQGKPPLSNAEIAELQQQIGTIHELHALSAEDFYDTVLRSIETNVYHLIIIDSIGNILANAEQENDSIHDKTYGGTSGPNTTFLKKMTNLMTMETKWGEVRDTCIIGINQVRDSINNPNKPYKAPGGNALEHAKLVDLYIESGKMLGDEESVYTTEGVKQKFRAWGKEVNWKIEKGKAGIHEGGRGSFNFLYDTCNVDFITDTLVAGVTHGAIEQAGAWLGIKDPDKPGEYLLRSQGKAAFVEALKKDAIQSYQEGEPSLMNYIRDVCFKTLDINIKYDWKD